MKNNMLFSVSFFLVVATAFSQSERTSHIDQTVKKISSSINDYKKTETVYDSVSQKTVYSKNNVVKLIRVKHIEEGIEKTVSWYFNDKQLIFSEQNWLNIKSDLVIDHEIFYMDNGRLISWINTDDMAVSEESTEFKKTDAALSAYGVMLLEKN